MNGDSPKASSRLTVKAAAIVGLVGMLLGHGLRAEDISADPMPPRVLIRVGTTRLRMPGRIAAMSFTPDGRRIIAGDTNAPTPRVAIFDVRDGRRVAQLEAPGRQGGWVSSLAVSPDGSRLLWGESTGCIALWDLAVGRMLFRAKDHKEEVSNVAFSPDGLRITSAGDAIRLRRTNRPEVVEREFRAKSGAHPAELPIGASGDPAFGCLAFTPDGTRIVGGSGWDGSIFIWRIEDGRLLREIRGAHGQGGSGDQANPFLRSVTVTPDGRRIMSVGQTTERIKDTGLKYGPKNVTMSEVRFWNIQTGARLADYRGPEETGFGFGALARDGRRVAVGDFGRLRILDANNGRALCTIELPGLSSGRPAFSPDGAIVAVPIDNALGLFAVETGRRLHHGSTTPVGHVESAAWSPSGDRIVVGQQDGFVRVWEASTGKLIWSKLLAPVIERSGWKASPAFVSFSHDGRLVVVAGRRDDPVRHQDGIVDILDAATGKTVREVVQQEIRWAALAPDDRMLVVATSNGVWGDVHFVGIEIATGRVRWSNPPANQRAGHVQIHQMQFEPRSPWFWATLVGGPVVRLNALTGHEQRRFRADWRPEAQKKGREPMPERREETTLSGDARTLALAGLDRIEVWDTATGAKRGEIPHRPARSCVLSLSAEGRTLAYAAGPDVPDNTIRLFDVPTGKPIQSLDPPDGRTVVMTFSPDGKKLFTGFDRSSGIVWDVRP